MVSLYKDPDGDTVFSAHNKTLGIHTVTNFLATERPDTQSDVETLKQRIEQLENQLKELMVKFLYHNLTIIILLLQAATDVGNQ